MVTRGPFPLEMIITPGELLRLIELLAKDKNNV